MKYLLVFHPSGRLRDPNPFHTDLSRRTGAQCQTAFLNLPGIRKTVEDIPDHSGNGEPRSYCSRISWAQLLKRMFDIDVSHCSHCGGQLKIIAAIQSPPVIARILGHLGLPTRAPQKHLHALSISSRQPDTALTPRNPGLPTLKPVIPYGWFSLVGLISPCSPVFNPFCRAQ